MRPSKLRLPDSTETATSLLFSIASTMVLDRAGVADAGGAAIADRVEAERVQLRRQAGLVEVLGHHLAAGRQRGLHPGLRVEAERAGLLRHQPGRDQHRRVRGVGAGRDRGDHDVAVADARSWCRRPRPCGRRRWPARPGLGELGVEGAGGVPERHPVLRPLRPGERRLDRRQVELQRVGEHRLGRAASRNMPCALQVGLDQPIGARRGRSGAGTPASARRRGRSRRWRRIRAPCCRWWRGRRPAGGRAPDRRTRRTCRPRPSCGASG